MPFSRTYDEISLTIMVFTSLYFKKQVVLDRLFNETGCSRLHGTSSKELSLA